MTTLLAKLGTPVLRSWDEMNESLLQLVEEQVAKVPENKQSRYLEAFVAQVPDVFREAAERFVAGLFKCAPEMLAEYQVLDDTYAAEVTERWGDALDVYRMLWVSRHETGGTIRTHHEWRYRPASTAPRKTRL